MPKDASLNSVFGSLSRKDLDTIRPSLTRVDLELSQKLSSPGRIIPYAYFPISGMISLVQRYSDGSTVEVGLVGRESFWGTPIILGIPWSPVEAMVQGEGQAMRISAKALVAAADRIPLLKDMLLRHAQFLQVQVAITAACNGLHTLLPRLSRWLLEANDRMDGDDMMLKHEFLSFMLGVRRAGVTSELSKLKSRGLIELGRGKVKILNRKGLESQACDCHRIVRREYNRIFA